MCKRVRRGVLMCCQRELDGDVTLCCAAMTGRPSVPLKCGGAAGICQNLYDSAPSGRYGTMSYLCRSVVQCLSMPTAADGNLDCIIQWMNGINSMSRCVVPQLFFLCFHRPSWTAYAHNHVGMFCLQSTGLYVVYRLFCYLLLSTGCLCIKRIVSNFHWLCCLSVLASFATVQLNDEAS